MKLWEYFFCAKKTKLKFSEDERRSYEFVMTWRELIMTEFSSLRELSLNETQNTWAMFEQIIPLQYFLWICKKRLGNIDLINFCKYALVSVVYKSDLLSNREMKLWENINN